MQRIIVKSVVTKPTKKEGTNITTIEDEKGAKMSAFNDAGLEKVHAGDVLEVEVEIDGKYANIKGWKLIESKPQPTPGQAPQPQREPFTSDPNKNASIQQCAAYNGVLNNYEKDIPAELKLAAVQWGLKQFGVVKAPEKPVVKEVVQPAQQEAALPIVASQAGIPADITTGAKLASYASKHGVTLAKFNSLLQSNPNDIKDIPAAWAILFPDGVPTK